MMTKRTRLRIWASALTLILLFTLIWITPILQSAPAAEAASPPRQLVLTAAPPQVAADGETYSNVVVQIQTPDGRLRPADEDITVFLTSSKVMVGTAEPRVTIREGDAFALARFTTTKTPGLTTITATASGFASGSGDITTVTPSGSPSKLAVFLGPNILLPDIGTTSSVVVQLVDSTGMPARASSDVEVTLTSSQIRVGTVDQATIVRAGTTLSTANFYASFAPGSTMITASASGFATGSAEMRVVGPIPSRIQVFAVPPRLIAGSGERGIVVVQLRDELGVPAKAPQKVEVSLFTSDTDVATVNSKLVIDAGSSYGTAVFYAGGAIGVTNVTAVASGYASGSSSVTMTQAGSTPYQLALHLAPNVVPAEVGSHRSVVVQTLDRSGLPVSPYSNLTVTISSSKTFIGTVQPELQIFQGGTYDVAVFNSTLFAGSTVFTAAAANLQPAIGVMSTSGSIPSQLKVTTVPRLIPADGSAYEAVVVQLEDENGLPAKAPSDIPVSLTSSRTDIGTTPATVVIPSGRTKVTAEFHTTTSAGATVITATSSGYASSSTEITTVEPYPSILKVFALPRLLPTDERLHEVVAVQIQDSRGTPAKPQNPVAVSLHSSDTEVGDVAPRVTINPQDTFARAHFNTTSKAGETVITATAPGFSTGFVKITTVSFPLTVSVTSSATTLEVGQDADLVATVTSEGRPISDVIMRWVAPTAALVSTSEASDLKGQASAVVSAKEAGDVIVAVVASKPGYETTVQRLNLSVTNPSPPPSLLSNPLLGWIAIAVPIGLVGVVLLMRRRRRAHRIGLPMR